MAVSITDAAVPAVDWVKLVAGPAGQRGNFCYSVATDSLGNIYVGSGPDLALSKLDPNGNRLWSIGIPAEACCAGNIDVRGISIDGTDNIYIVGSIWGRVNVGGISYNDTTLSTFLAKMTSAGSNIFTKIFYRLYNDGKPLGKTADTGFTVGGSFNNPVVYEGITLVPTASLDVAVFKVDANGVLAWARRGAGTLDDYLDALASTPDGDILVAGTFNSGSIGMAGLIAPGTGSKTLYLMRIDSQGTGRWAKTVSSSMDAGNFITVSSAVGASKKSNSTVWAGDFSGSLNLSSSSISAVDGKDVFLVKISSSGDTVWARTLSGVNDQFASAVLLDDFDNIYLTGFFDGQIKIGAATFNSYGLQDIFVAKFSPDGTPVWAKQIGWTGKDRYPSLCFVKEGGLLISGSAAGGVYVDGQFVEGSSVMDGFLIKLKPEGIPPRFVIQPESRAVSAGMTLTLATEIASNDLPVSYQWWFNGTSLTNETDSTLTIGNFRASQAGSYYLVAKNAAGEAQSNPALLSFTDASNLILSVHPSLTIFGTVGKTYQIEYATELRGAANWTLATNLTLSATPQIWVDPQAATGEKRFYRVLLQGP